ncbi:MAG: cytidylate kinase family protein [Deltaproteobacteria bacterium]|jgi:cytidylate kinase|nr:cytidylate kinase family protein [Deltaproteobacteria bacterium]
MLVTITGKLGSGKSTICSILSKKAGFEVYSTGVIHRNLAKQMGIDTLALNQLMSNDSSYDLCIDNEVKRIAAQRPDDRLIFDSRLAWHFVQKSLKIFTTVDPNVAAKRVFHDQRGHEETYTDLADAVTNLRLRAKLERDRFKGMYGVDYCDYQNFDLILDSTWLAPQLLADQIIDQWEGAQGLMSPPKAEIFISPKSLYPTASLGQTFSPPSDNFRNNPLKIVCLDGFHFVTGDHEPLGTALAADLPYVFASLDPEATVPSQGSLDPALLLDPQSKGRFSYAGIPEAYCQGPQ